MTHQAHPSVTREAVQLLAEHGFEGMARAMELLINECMKIERQQALGVGPYQRGEARRGQANGFKPRRVKTRIGQLELAVPQVRGAKFYPRAWNAAAAVRRRFAWPSRRCTCKASRRRRSPRSPKNCVAARSPVATSAGPRRCSMRTWPSGETGRSAR